MKLFKKIYILIGIVIFIIIIKDIDFTYYRFLLPTLNYYLIILANFLLLPLVFVKSYRWRKIMEAQGINYSLKDSFLMYGAGLFLGFITPGRLGEFSKTIYLLKDGGRLGHSLFNSLLDRIFDGIFMLMFFAAGAFLLPFLYPQINYYSLLLLGIIFLFIIIFLFVAMRYWARLKSIIIEIIQCLHSFNFKNIVRLSLITIFSWLIYFVMIYFLAASIGLEKNVSFFYLSFSAILAGLITVLPISILGIGTRDAVLLFVLSPLGIQKETIIAFSFLLLFNYLFASLIGIFCWFKKPIPFLSKQ